LFFEDPRESEGELLFPERFPRSVVDGYKTSKGSYAYAGQYQQRPSPREGGLFSREWFEGDGTPGTSRILQVAPPCVVWIRAWDFAGTAKRAGNDPDRTAHCLMGRTADDRFIIAHAGAFQESPANTEKRVKGIATNDGAHVPVRIPEDPAAGGKFMVRDVVRVLAGHTVKAVRPVGTKEARAGGLATQAEHGNVWLVQGEWVNDWLDEVCNFPNARYDDQVDAAADAFNDLAPTVVDSRHASAGERRTANVIEENRQGELERRVQQARTAHSVPGRMTGIM